MRIHFFAVVVLATVSVSPLRSQSLAGARIGLASQSTTQLAQAGNGARAGNAWPVASSEGSGDRWARGMVIGAAVGLLFGLLIHVNGLQTGEPSHSLILPAVGVGALLGLIIGTG